MEITINNTALAVKEYDNKRVITLKDIDDVHGRPSGTARKRFNDNRQHFIDGEDFYEVTQPSEIRTLGITRPQGGIPEKVILITESGYLMLVKSFTDDLAWDVQRRLVKDYFRFRTILDSYQIDDSIERAKRWIEEEEDRRQLRLACSAKDQQIQELQPRADYTDKILKNKDLVTITQIAKDYGMSAQKMNKTLHDLGVQYKQSGQWLLYAKHQQCGYTHSETHEYTKPDGTKGIAMETKWRQKGRLFIYNLLKQNNILPLIEREAT